MLEPRRGVVFSRSMRLIQSFRRRATSLKPMLVGVAVVVTAMLTAGALITSVH